LKVDWIHGSPDEFQSLRHRLFVISGKDDFQSFSAVGCMYLESENAESLVTAHVKIGQAD
jgi:hypothetical protein